MVQFFRQKLSPLAIIVAVDEAGGFGKEGKIPWDYPEDLKHFQQITKGQVCIMGRKTYEDMVKMMEDRGKDMSSVKAILPNRDSFVITSNQSYSAPGATVAPSIRQAVQELDENDHRTVFVIGGERLFIEAMSFADTIYMTIVPGDHQCDRFFPLPALMKNWKLVEGTVDPNNNELRYVTYKRK